MQVFSPLMSRSNSRLARVLALVLPMVVLLAGLLSQTAMAENTYVITDGDQVRVHTSYASNPAEVLTEAGVELSDDDYYTTLENGGVSEITVQRSQLITVTARGITTQTTSFGEPVAKLLDRMGIPYTGNFVPDKDPASMTYDGMSIHIDELYTQGESYTMELPFRVSYIDDPTLPIGWEKVVSEGKVGQAVCSASVTYKNGAEFSRVDGGQIIVTQPQDQLILRGTLDPEIQTDAEGFRIDEEGFRINEAGERLLDENGEPIPAVTYPIIGNGYIIMETGEVLTYTHSDIYMGTGYTSWIEDVGDTTATGTFARYGAVAVDPDIIPYGTRMFIVSRDGEYIYGIATAEDCGGGVNDKHIDLFYDTVAECFQFGRRDIVVYFLGEADWRGPQHRR